MVRRQQWQAVVPFWATWPFETLVIPQRPVARLDDLDGAARDDLASDAAVDRHATTGCSGGSSRTRWAGTRRRSATGRRNRGSSTPTTIRRCSAATVRKFMVGYELLAEPQRDLTPEDAAEQAARRSRLGAGGRREEPVNHAHVRDGVGGRELEGPAVEHGGGEFLSLGGVLIGGREVRTSVAGATGGSPPAVTRPRSAGRAGC